MSSLALLDASLAVLGIYLIKRLLSRRASAPYPPGPKGLPLIGNVLDMPTSQEWKVFTQWGEKYGGIIYLNLLGQPMILLNSLQATMEMLDKKSSIYSDRPSFEMGSRIIGWERTLALTPYGDRFREYRRMLHRLIGNRLNMEKLHPIEELETHRFLRRILESPDDVSEHIRKTAGAIILKISHGYQIKEHNDPFIINADTATDQFSKATEPGAFMVDLLPLLRYVPDWMPGTGWKRTAREWKANLAKMADMPHDFVKREMASGTAIPSFTSDLLEEKLSPDQEFNVKWAAASLYSGGADTTVSAIYTFFLAMTLFPEAQRKAQAEIDAVVGHDRLPNFHDRERLPYVDALVKEVLRWNPVVPLGVPHRLMEDDIQDGLFIPKGSIVMPNIWKFLHDEQTYKNPMDFDPARFIASEGKEAELDPHELSFGFGRRICPGGFGINDDDPGLNLADASVYISCAMALAVFDISKKIENGVVVEPVNDYTSGTISHPKPFKCAIKPRSQKAVSLITSVSLSGED
ncbi:cytochrome P450 [Dentipellis sp. KUC8613]|nr:cytochrome P450 [Dentipellis sp. KUC8613]